MHEFGHRLQEIINGKGYYYLKVVPTSGLSYSLYEDKIYRRTWTEIEANTLSFVYFGFPSYWNFKYYPVDVENLVEYIELIKKVKK